MTLDELVTALAEREVAKAAKAVRVTPEQIGSLVEMAVAEGITKAQAPLEERLQVVEAMMRGERPPMRRAAGATHG